MEEERENQCTEVDPGKEVNAMEAENTKPKENETENVSKEGDTINYAELFKRLLDTPLISPKLPEIQTNSEYKEDLISEGSKSEPVSIDKTCDSIKQETKACYSCCFCEKDFINREACSQHIRQNHKPSEMEHSSETFGIVHSGGKKNRINKKADSGDEMKVNFRGFKPKPSSYICVICSEECPSRIALSEHSRKHKEDPTCLICQTKCSNIKALRQHMLRVHSDKKYVLCAICGKSVRKNHLSTHLRVHSGVKPFQCEICDKCFSQKCHLERHMKCHNNEKDHCCVECGQLFLTRQNLNTHMKVHIDKGDVQYTCKTCNESFSKWQSLNKHEREAHQGKRFVCHVCNIEFMYSSFLYEHYLAQHTEEDILNLDSEVRELVYKKQMLSVMCEICNKSIFKYQMKTHMKIHTGEKPFKCNHCDKEFRLYHYLTKHERTHTGERPYQCKFCNKTFTQSAHLKNHIVLHTGEKPYKCRFCDKAFAIQSYLYNHEKIHTRDSDAPARIRKVYECTRCGKKFKIKRDCMDHESSCQFIKGDTSSGDISGKDDDIESMKTNEHSGSTIDNISTDCVPSSDIISVEYDCNEPMKTNEHSGSTIEYISTDCVPSSDINSVEHDGNESMKTNEHTENPIDDVSTDCVPSDQFEPEVILKMME